MNNKRKWLSGAALSTLGAALASPALAQVPTTTPPVREVIDERGVDLFRGQIVARQSLLSIGGDQGLTYDVIYRGKNAASSGYGALDKDASGTVYTVSFAGRADRFTLSGGLFTPDEPRGQQLKQDTTSPNLYIYTNRDGSTVVFDANFANTFTTGNMNGNAGRITSMTSPTGQKTTFAYTSGLYCTSTGGGGSDGGIGGGGGGGGVGWPHANTPQRRVGSLRGDAGVKKGGGSPRSPGRSSDETTEDPSDTGDPTVVEVGDGGGGTTDTTCDNKAVVRLSSITSAYGYQLAFGYDASDPNDARGLDYWWAIKTVTAKNLAGCAPAATCAWPTLDLTNVTATMNVAADSYVTGVNGVTSRRPYNGNADSLTVGYDAQGRVATTASAIELNLGLSSSYSYTDSGSGSTALRTVVVTNSLGKPTTYKFWLTSERLKSVTDALIHTTEYTYDAKGRLTRTTAPDGSYSEQIYDDGVGDRGNVIETHQVGRPGTNEDVTHPGNWVITKATFPTTCANIATCNQPATTISAMGNVAGNVANQYTTNYSYNPDGTLAAVTPPKPYGSSPYPQTRYTYATLHPKVLDGGGNLVDGSESITVLQAVSQCRTTASCTGAADETRQVTTYDAARNLLPKTVETQSGDGALSALTTMAYDPLGNLVSVDGPLAGTGDTTTYRYDNFRRLVGVISPDPDGAGTLKQRAQKASYGNDWSLDSVEVGTVNGTSDTDWSNFTSLAKTAYQYGTVLNLRAVFQSFGGTLYATTNTAYDSLGRTTCVAQRLNPTYWGTSFDACQLRPTGPDGPDRISQTSYDDVGRVSGVVSALGTPDQSTDVRYTYSTNGAVATLTDARDAVTRYDRDGLGRVTRITYPRADGASTPASTDYDLFTYDQASNPLTHQLRNPSNPAAATISYSYDKLDRLIFKTRAGGEPQINYDYDLVGNVIGATPSSGTSGVTMSYDALGRVTAEGQPVGTLSYGYDAAGRRTSVAWSDGFSATYTYLTTGEMKSVLENGTTTLATYSYDDLGRRTRLAKGGTAVVSTYGYATDSPYMTSLANTLTGTAPNLTIGLGYTAGGQIKQVTRTSTGDAYAWTGHYNVDRPYTANALNQLASAGTTALGYDGRGNLTSSGPDTFGYTRENLLKSRNNGTTLAYDATNRLIRLDATGYTAQFLYEGGEIASEYDASGVMMRRYVHGAGNDEPLVTYLGAGSSKQYLATDERGSVIAVYDVASATTTINRYDEFGIPAATNAGRFGYTGQVWLPELGMYYYKARMYSPTLGRFMQTDSIGYGDGMNWYGYVGADPVNLVDPSGLASSTKCGTAKTCKSEGGPGGGTPGDIIVNGQRWYPSAAFDLGNHETQPPPTTTEGGVYVGVEVVVTANKPQNGIEAGAEADIVVTAQLPCCGLLCRVGRALGIGRVGAQGEAAVRAQFDIGPKVMINVDGQVRFPDGLNDTTLSEVKNVARLSYTGQLRSYVTYSQRKGLQFDLYVRSSTRLAAPLLGLQGQGAIRITNIPGM